MAGRQGFITNGETYVYQESVASKSAAFGLDGADNKWKLKVLDTIDAIPSGSGNQFVIDPSTNGNVTVTPNGTGIVAVTKLTASGILTAGAAFTVSSGTITLSTLANGVVLSSGTGVISSLDPGAVNNVLISNGAGVAPSWGAVPATAGVSSLAGTANQITASAATGAVTLSTPSTFIAPGSIAATTTVTATSGNITATNGNIEVGNTAAATTTPSVDFLKSRSGGVITSGDLLGTITFQGIGTGTTYTSGASITCTSSGTIGANRVASNMVFATHPDSASGATPTTRMTIASTGAVTIATPDSGVGLTITAGGLTVTAGSTTLTPLNASGMVKNDSSGVLTTTATTNHTVQVGNSSGQLTSLGVGTNGQVLLGASAADPSWVTPTAGSGLTLTTNSTTLSYAITAPVSIALGGTNATSMTTTDGVVYYDGTRLVTTSAGTAGQVLTSNGAGVAPTYQAAGGSSFTWTVTTSNGSLVAANGYIANKSGLLTMTLPATATVGDTISITGINTAVGWRVAQNASQKIYFGTQVTTTGTGGYLEATNIRDTITFICVATNTDFQVISSIGNITVV